MQIFFSHIWVAVRKNWQCQHYMWHLFVKLNVDCINNIITSRWTTFYRIHTVFLLSFFLQKTSFLPMGSCWFRCEPVFRESGPLHLNWFCGLFNFVPMSPPIGLRQMFIREMWTVHTWRIDCINYMENYGVYLAWNFKL